MLDINFNKSLKKISNNFFKKIKKGSLFVTYPDNEKVMYRGDQNGYEAEIKLFNYKVFSKLLVKGSIGFAESYMEKDFTSDNLSELLLFAYDNQSFFLKKGLISEVLNKYRRIKHHLNENTKSRSKKNISFHYDLGNEFYKLWLDPSMTYSSGIFTNSNKDLHIAQKNKYKEIANNLNLNENSNVLEIGCGWGGFSSYIAKEYGSRVNAITISKEQFEFTSKKIFHEGLNEKVNVEMKDYRDIDKKYTNIASIEMFEAVGKKYWKVFFNILKESLKEEGSAALQIITIKDEKAEFYQNNPDFIQQYIFPGGVLPSKKQLKDINLQLGLQINEIQNFSQSYAKTLNIWKNEFQNAWPQIASQGFKDRFKKMWEYYLSYCEVGFIAGTTDVSHFVITK